jgi:diguanylate cyclase (GGDEF)-like protein
MRDPPLLALGLFTLFGCALLAVFGGAPTRQMQIFWAVQVPLDAALMAAAWRMRRMALGRLRRFWSMIAFAAAAFTTGDTLQLGHTVIAPGVPSVDGGATQTVFLGIGLTAVVVACLVFPQGLRTRREKIVFWLDAGTLLVGGGVAAWCLAVNPIGGASTDRTYAAVSSALVLVAAFSATRVALIPAPPMVLAAAWPMVVAAIVQGVSALLPDTFQDPAHPWAYAIRVVPAMLAATGPRIEELHLRLGETGRPAKRRPYSLLPYGMIAVTLVIFFAMVPDRASNQLLAAAVGVVVITSLVAGRQLIEFRENVILIDRLDVALGELRDHEGLLLEQASVDGLTRLANRTHFLAETCRLLGSDTAGPDEAAVLLIDLDDFKTINDTMGHPAGDALLVAVAQRLRQAVRADDVVARLGGDEFAILMPGADAAVAAGTAEEILRRLAVPMELEQHTIVTRASIGVTGARRGDEPSTLLSNADIAMYEAKRRGRSTWVGYTDEMGARIGGEAVLIRELGQAVEAGEFELEYQPIVRLADGTLTGVEALIRWNHPTRGRVSPIEFIPIAERTGQIVVIGRWAMREACRQAADWRRCFPAAADMTVSVNVAGRQLRTPNFVGEVGAVLADTGLPAGGLIVEVTETAVLDDEDSNEAMLALRGLGVKLALDDFGTAASSLGLLLTCPVTTLKLDRSFVESITTVGRQAAVATAVSQMANALNLASVAEGIENDEQRVLLQQLGYQYGQGYHFSRPLPADRMGALWAAGADGESGRVAGAFA